MTLGRIATSQRGNSVRVGRRGLAAGSDGRVALVCLAARLARARIAAGRASLIACRLTQGSEGQRWLEINKWLLFTASLFGLLATGAAAQTPPPKGWLPPERLREELPAKFFGTWCKVKEHEESEEYQ